MKVAYLVMTHENPRLLQRTIQALSFNDPDCAFFIHLDLKTPFDKFSGVSGQNVHFIENRIPVFWGEFSQVDATLSLIREAIASPNRYDYFVLITGSCYPLRSGGYIRRFFEAGNDSEYMEIVKVPAPGYPLARFEAIRFPSSRPALRFLFRALGRIGLGRRDHQKRLKGLSLYAGEGAWALSRRSCEYILQFVATHPHVEAYFRNSFAPDESFVHTIVGNSDFLNHVQPNIVYAVWPGPSNGHPAIITLKEVAKFERENCVTSDRPGEFQEMLFARKINDRSPQIIRRIDTMIERKEGIELPFSMDFSSEEHQRI
ncbi:MAG TPA: beta-1,6-N-acetylglucosaminyltransferase [Dongiaceae bacterium]|nr:beta-1,6-N-acetylglucosaminyltransferase [Dongiaceae bacterium]